MKVVGTIYLPNGQEHKVYAEKFVPDTPPEQVIVFPDKREFRVDWRRNLRQMIETTKLIEEAEIVQEEGIYNVPITNPEIPYVLGLAFSDAHIGSYTTDHQLIIDLMDTILATPNAFLMDAGDTFDDGIWGGLEMEQLMPPYMQQFTVADLMREMGDKWACSVLGNHTEWMFEAAGQKPEQIFARHMKGVIFPGMGLLHLVAGECKYDIAISHNYWGKSKLNIHNVCANLRKYEYPSADAFIVGHEHIWGYMKERAGEKEVLYCRPGTAKLRDRYARIHGIARRGQACGIAILFGTKERSMEAHPLDMAVERMKSYE